MKYRFSIFACLVVGLMPSGRQAGAQNTAHRPWFQSSRAQVPSTDVDVEPVREHVGNPRMSKGHEIAHQALRYRGARYRFGGNSKKKGFDCSGLVERVYNDLKFKKLPHTSSALYRMGKPVHLSELRPGDLVFFKNTYRPGISHVGVYAGNNRFVHAQNRHRGVTLTSMADPYFQLHYAGARRLY